MTENQPFENIPLDQIDPNPYSCRLSEDAEHVRKIADSIKAQGMLQLPMGRRVDRRVQLVFGHTRLAAYKLLLSETYNPGFEEMPVILRELDDDEMFRYGISENLARKDLTPIEEAKAMLRYRDEFKKTSDEIGALFGLSGSAVRNKIRLLQLPDEIIQKLAVHEISEGAARALLELYDLPEELRNKAEKQGWQGYHPSVIVQDALAGHNAEDIHESISGLIRNYSQDMSEATWKWDEIILRDLRVVGICKGCKYQVKNDKNTWCLKRECFNAKTSAMKKRYLEAASAVIGIKVIEGDSDTSVTKFPDYSGATTGTLDVARSIHCPNLRLIYDDYGWKVEQVDHLKSVGYPKAQIVCGKQQQWCSCIQAVKAGLQDKLMGKVAPKEIVSPVERIAAGGDKILPDIEYVPVESSEDSGEPSAITEDELKDIGRQARQQKKEAMVEIEAINLDAAKQIAVGLLDINTNPKLLLEILRAAGGRAYEIETDHVSLTDNPSAWCDEIRLMIGKRLVFSTGAENYYYQEPDPAKSLARLNVFLRKAGLQELESVSAETVSEEA
jgi:ParB/RepB/Spo0J family partition protein